MSEDQMGMQDAEMSGTETHETETPATETTATETQAGQPEGLQARQNDAAPAELRGVISELEDGPLDEDHLADEAR